MKQEANATYDGRYVSRGTAHEHAPVRRTDGDRRLRRRQPARAISARDRPGRHARRQRPTATRCSAAARAASDGKLLERPARHRRAPARRRRRHRRAAHERPAGPRHELDDAPRRRARTSARARTGSTPPSSRLPEIEESTHATALEHRGRRHGRDHHQVLDPAGRLPVGAERRRATSCRRRCWTSSTSLTRRAHDQTLKSTRFGDIEIPTDGPDRVPERPDRPARHALRARRRTTRAAPFLWLHSMDDPDLALPVTKPWRSSPTTRWSSSTPRPSGSASRTPPRPRCLVTVRADERVEDFSANLRAPIMIVRRPRLPGHQRGRGRARARAAVRRASPVGCLNAAHRRSLSGRSKEEPRC